MAEKARPYYGAIRMQDMDEKNPDKLVEENEEEQKEDKGLDKDAVYRVRSLLVAAACFTLLFAIAELVGAILSYSLCLLVNSTAYIVIFSRLLFLAFLMQCAGRPASRLANYRQHKPELFLVGLMLLVSWLIMGGSLFVAVNNTVDKDYHIGGLLKYLITAAVGAFYALIVILIMCCGGKLAGPRRAARRERQGSASIGDSFDDYARERGLLLRRTLKNVPMRPYLYMTVWFSIQCFVALAAALVYWFLPDDVPAYLDLILAYVFSPLAFISSAQLAKDFINILSDGILQGLDATEVTESLKCIKGVRDVHDLYMWALSMDRLSLSVTLVLERSANVEEIINKASALLKAKYDVFEYKIETERDRLGPPPRRGGIRESPSTTY